MWRPSAGVAVVRCLQIAVDRGFLGERWDGKSSDRLGPHHWGSNSRRPFCITGSVSGGAALSVKREHRETNAGRMREEAKKHAGIAGKFRHTSLVHTQLA